MTPLIPIKNKPLLTQALTHRSYLNEHKDVPQHNERLEFLGDAVLELAVSIALYHQFPDRPEGELTALRSALVRTTTLAQVATKLGLGEKLRLSRGEAASGGRTNPTLLANTFEAVIGALYLDQGLTAVVALLEKRLFPQIKDIVEKGLYKDFKSTLQEVVQAQGQPTPEYQVVHEEGPDHNKRFTVEVTVGQKTLATGVGKSKQEAQQQAAQLALEKASVN